MPPPDRRITIQTPDDLPGLEDRGDAMTKEFRDSLTPDVVLALGKRGNERFRSGQPRPRDFLKEVRATSAGQYPAAIILSCIDSRAPAEVIMDLRMGDVFNSRVAGFVVNDDILGGMEFACQIAGARLVLVLGHTSCGAVKGAIDGVRLGNLTGLLEKIRPAIEATPLEGERSSENAPFVDAVARRNVELSVEAIRRRSEILRSLEERGAVRIVGAMYDLDSARVDFFD
jgi:carbonic anhydrase